MAIWEDIDEDENMYDGPDGYDDEEDEELDLELAAEQLMETAAQEADSDDEIDADFMPEESAHPSQPSIPPFYLNLQILGRFLSQSGYRSARIQEQVFAQEKYFEEVKTPQINGSELLNGGEFGRIGQRLTKKEHSLAWNLLSQQSSNGRIHREDIATPLVPNSNGTVVAEYGSRPYAGQFSTDSSFFYTCCQDFRLHFYDAKAGPIKPRFRDMDHETTMKPIKTVDGNSVSWTITDSHLSPDNENLIYASMTPTLYMVKTRDPENQQIPLYFGDTRNNNNRYWGSAYSDFSLWSCRFSNDGKEIVAGGGGDLYVYDLNAMRRTTAFPAHLDDVNSCCWADAGANVLISASDDTFCKVWDRRSLRSHPKPAGLLVGHTEGITYVSAKGDGRYVISNGKDQALRLWDLRKMRSNEEYESWPTKNYSVPGFDYRSSLYPKPKYNAHPKDCSVMTYRGHSVLKTLIRCHFSPAETTGGKYIYSGSADGKIHVWSLDGRIVQVIDRSASLPMSYDPSEPDPPPLSQRRVRGNTCVRDVSWHPEEPVIMSVGWRADNAGSLVRHEFKGFGKNGMSLEDAVEEKEVEPVD